MNDKEKVDRRDSNRYRILKLVYDEIKDPLAQYMCEEMFIDESQWKHSDI